MIDWIVYYANGKSFTNEDGKPEDAPRQGVLVVAVRDQMVGRKLLFDQDTYCWQNEQWIPHDRFCCERYIDETKHPIRLCGYWVRDDSFKAAIREATSDKRLPDKIAKHPQEPTSIVKWLRDKDVRNT